MYKRTIMKKYSAVLFSGFVIILLSTLSSCKDDEPVKYSLTFSKSTLTADESDDIIEIEIKLDKPAPEKISIDYELTGTAFDNIRAQTTLNEDADFAVEGTYGEIAIKKGETSAILKLIPFSDDYLEDDETIIINFKSTDNTQVTFEATENVTVTLNQEDGVAVVLEWPVTSVSGVADMDMIVRIGKTAENPVWNGILTGSVYRGFEYNYEFVFLPKTFIGTYFDLNYTDATYGMTYTYYDGSLDPLNFKVTYIDFINGDLEPVANGQVFEQSYSLANLNKWVSSSVPTIIAQTFRNNNGVFSDISPITKQETSSRVVSSSSNQTILNHRTSKTLDLNRLPAKFKNKLIKN